jgi:hypothetical protein
LEWRSSMTLCFAIGISPPASGMNKVGQLLTRLLKPSGAFRPGPVLLGDRVFALTHRGQIIYLPPSDLDLTPRILRDGRWEPHVELTIARCLRRGDTVIEVGAWVRWRPR